MDKYSTLINKLPHFKTCSDESLLIIVVLFIYDIVDLRFNTSKTEVLDYHLEKIFPD